MRRFVMWGLCCWLGWQSGCEMPPPPPKDVAALAAVSHHHLAPPVPDPALELDSLLQARTAAGLFNGVVLIVHRDKILHAGAYGYADYRQGDTLELGTRFQLASVSKMFTAVAILKLVEQGKLALDTSLQAYLPALPYPALTLRHLLQHRSGLPRYMGLAHEHWDRKVQMNCQDVVRLFAEKAPELWFVPGSQFNYSNSNYALLAAIVERVSGQAFPVFLSEQVFQPLGMENSFVADYATRRQQEMAATGYKNYRRGPRNMEGDYLDGVFGDKGVYSSIMDLFRFDQALNKGEVLSNEFHPLLFQPAEMSQRDDYGMGWRLKPNMPAMAYHFGWWRGFRNAYIRDMDQGFSCLILSNLDLGPATLDFWQLFNIVQTCIWPELS